MMKMYQFDPKIFRDLGNFHHANYLNIFWGHAFFYMKTKTLKFQNNIWIYWLDLPTCQM